MNRAVYCVAAGLALSAIACAQNPLAPIGARPTATPFAVAAPTNPAAAAAPTEPAPASPGAPAAPTDTAAALSGSPVDVVVNAFRALRTHSFRKREWLTDVVRGSPPDLSQPARFVQEYVPPDRFHLITTLSAGETTEDIEIGDRHYYRAGAGAWEEYTDEDAPGRSDAVEEFLGEVRQKLESGAYPVEALGGDAVGGAPAQVYQVTGQMPVETGGATVNVDFVIKLWIRIADGLLLRMDSRSQAPGASFPIDDIVTYEYDPGIAIEAPVP